MPRLSYFLSGKCILLTTSSLAVRPSVSFPPVEHPGNYEMCSLPLPSILWFSQCLTSMETRLQHTVPNIISSTKHMPFLYPYKTDKWIAARIVSAPVETHVLHIYLQLAFQVSTCFGIIWYVGRYRGCAEARCPLACLLVIPYCMTLRLSCAQNPVVRKWPLFIRHDPVAAPVGWVWLSLG